MKPIRLLFVIALMGTAACRQQTPVVTMETLLDEMTTMERLQRVPEVPYRAVQFSSYDRRSVTPDDTTWFCNDDGFGGESIPGFEKVLVPPDSTGTGEYLICDIQAPGVIQRLWTAVISGKIRFFLDNAETPLYEGNAADFFWKTGEVLAGPSAGNNYSKIFRQFDATYLPIPFSSRCRIEWIGKLAETHFYHVGVRIYEQGTRVEPFSAEVLSRLAEKITATGRLLAEPGLLNPTDTSAMVVAEAVIEPGTSRTVHHIHGTGAIDYLGLKIDAADPEAALRQTVLSIWFDGSAEPQVHAPVGDFFGAAPGVNPYQSVPLSVAPDGTLECRFLMPFRRSVQIDLQNFSAGKITLTAKINPVPLDWKRGKSMHFGARWTMSRNLTTGHTDSRVVDIPYIDARGTGRVVGAAAYLYNPSGVTTSWGNWWGEGDEKIFVDRDTFPVFFGTGSEDYFNYSWSSPRIFAYPYCGQPRNDGPDNRGYVANYRWHIADDIPFTESIRFFMELRHHGEVAGFDYGRIVYFYALPSAKTGYVAIKKEDVQPLPYYPWLPEAYLGSSGFKYFQAEELAVAAENLYSAEGKLWAGRQILTWQPKSGTEQLRLNLPSGGSMPTRIAFTLAHGPGAGTIRCMINGTAVKIDNQERLNLRMPHRTVLRNHFLEVAGLRTRDNRLVLEMTDADGGNTAQIDFIWLRY